MTSEFYTIALGIEYLGSKYHGWQIQKNACSIQEELEKAISRVANQSIKVFCAGRTDKGVHSIGQVVHFKTTKVHKDSAWTLGVNMNLSKDISVCWIKRVPDDFHARFSAVSRHYRYIIYNSLLRSSILNKTVAHYHRFMDADRMHRAAQCLIGEKDFTSFRSRNCQSSTPFRHVIDIQVNRFNNYVVIDITANSFLYRMVRNITSNLIKVGMGYQSENWIFELLKAKRKMFTTAPAKPEGLCLVEVCYPTYLNIPKPSTLFNFIRN